MKIVNYNYKAENITPGIVHIGVGNFHRAHQAFYTNLLLEDNDQSKWGICGVSLLPTDKKIVDNLKLQHLDYTLTVCSSDAKEQVYKIGAIRELIAGYENPQAVIEKIAQSSIKVISLTITEGGYNLSKESGEFILTDEKIIHDIENPANPKTVFGFIAEGLRLRRKQGTGGITILSCDNLQHNGDTAKKAFTSFIKAQDKELSIWTEQNVTFPNSMVDRITPATKAEDIDRLNKNSGINDMAPVYCEDFIQWVIEDNFIAGRPAWERAGVEFTENVTAFENMKLSLLNASHTLLSYPSFLMGYRAVDKAMGDPEIDWLIRSFMDIDVTPYIEVPQGVDLDAYKKVLIQRFSNSAVSDQVSRLCFDGISKFPVYILPTAIKMITDQKDLIRLAFLLACYRHYLKYKTDDNGQIYEIAEPWISNDDIQLISSENAIDFLGLSAFKSTDLKASAAFTELYAVFVCSIKEKGVREVLRSMRA